jgi:hypothetical protein
MRCVSVAPKALFSERSGPSVQRCIDRFVIPAPLAAAGRRKIEEIEDGREQIDAALTIINDRVCGVDVPYLGAHESQVQPRTQKKIS